MANAMRAGEPNPRPILRRILSAAAVVIAALLGWIVGRMWGWEDPIPPVHVEQFYGVAAGTNQQGQYCIDNSTEGLRCAVLRVGFDITLPREGTPVRGGFARLPNDTSDPREASWLWVTELACGWKGTEAATICP
jgi:hypothetical protein